MHRDLWRPFAATSARIPITIRPFRRADAEHFAGPPGLWRKMMCTRIDQVSRTHFIEAHLSSCYVSVTADGSPCFIQWVIAPSADDKVTSYRKAHVPALSDDEVLLVGGFIPERHRGKRIQACATCQTAEIARGFGARWAVVHVEASNLTSLRGLLAAGFHPYILTKVTWRAFRRKVFVSRLVEEEGRSLEAFWKQSPGKSPPAS